MSIEQPQSLTPQETTPVIEAGVLIKKVQARGKQNGRVVATGSIIAPIDQATASVRVNQKNHLRPVVTRDLPQFQHDKRGAQGSGKASGKTSGPGLGQLITPNPDISCTPGLCLVYVQQTFGVGPKYPTASAAWKASKHKHRDQDFPVGIWVPVWFAMKGNPDGHVALRQPDGSIWSSSSPTATVPVHHASLDDLESYYEGRLTYRGWTEDIEDTLIMSSLSA